MSDSKIYCLKCKKKTDTNDIKMVSTKNDRFLVKGYCVECGGKKSNFISKKKASVKDL